MYDTTAIFIGDDSTVGEATVDYVMGVRPAFCIDKTTEIIEIDSIDGQRIYVMK